MLSFLSVYSFNLNNSYSWFQVSQLEAHLHIDSFRNNASVNMTSNYAQEKSNGSFIRKGAVGDWMNHFSPEIIRSWSEWIEKETAGTDIPISMNN